MRSIQLGAMIGALAVMACAPTDRPGDTGSTTTIGPTTTVGDGDGDMKFDAPGGGIDIPFPCEIPEHTPCDIGEDKDRWHAIGVNCPDEFEVEVSSEGAVLAFYTLDKQLGTYNPPTYPILEGEKMLVMSTGEAWDVETPGSEGSTEFPGEDPGKLPAPMNPEKVDEAQTCADDPGLVGMGDCSNTIYDQWSSGAGAFDYAEMRLTTTVPMGTNGFAYNFAFLSWEYPNFYKWEFNDMYVAWLESEDWTGNISFDEFGNPISLNAGFLDYKDAPNIHDCPPTCEAPELEGTGLEGHAGTRWLETQVGVVPGEQITLILAIFDMNDSKVDSAVLLDDFRWTCEGGPPFTQPG